MLFNWLNISTRRCPSCRIKNYCDNSFILKGVGYFKEYKQMNIESFDLKHGFVIFIDLLSPVFRHRTLNRDYRPEKEDSVFTIIL